MQYTLFTDGSCLKNPGGAGGYAAILLPDMSQAVGGDRSTTNNRMEMKAIIEGLKMLPPKSNVLVVSDSQLAINCAARKWKRKKNLDLWSEYDEASAGHNIDSSGCLGTLGTSGMRSATDWQVRRQIGTLDERPRRNHQRGAACNHDCLRELYRRGGTAVC